MAERRQGKAPAFDPEAAREWREFANYVARVGDLLQLSGPTHDLTRRQRDAIEALSDDELRSLARRRLDDPARREPANRVLHALDAAAEGRPYNPYTDRRTHP